MAAARRPAVLIIEDDPGVRRLIQRTLEAFCDVQGVGSGEEGVHQARLAPPDIILVDMRMPGMDGLTVLAQLKGHERTRGIPVIIVSAIGETAMLFEGQRAGALDYLIKPFEPDQLQKMVRKHLYLGGEA